MGPSLKQLHYQDCLWLSLLYFWLLKVFYQRKKKQNINARECSKPFVVLVRTAGSVWLISAGSSSKCYRQIKCSEETGEWKSVTLLDTDGSELWQLPSPSLPSRFLMILCTLTSGNYADTSVCWIALGMSRSEVLPGDYG